MTPDPAEADVRPKMTPSPSAQPAAMKQDSDARRYARRPYAGLVVCVDDEECDLASLDLSAGGVGVLSTRSFAVGQKVTLAFLKRNVQVEGVVRRVRLVYSCDWQVGIAFSHPQNELVDVVRSVS